MPEKSINNWKAEAINQIKASRVVTEYKGISKEDIPYTDYPNYSTHAYNPDLEKLLEKIYLISGTDSQIMLQASLLTAIYQILGDVLGYAIDFEMWFLDFSYEFKVNHQTSKARIAENKKNVTYWGRTKEQRPNFEWLDNKDNNYKVIKFYPNRKKEKEFKIIGGTESEIRNHLLLLMALENIGGNSDKPDKKVFTELKQMSSSPCIYLIFREENPEEGSAAEAKVTINLTDCVENSKFKARPSDKVLGVPELKQYKKLIEQNFLPTLDNPYTLRKGAETYTYANWRLGYHTWLPFLNKASAIEFYTKMCAIKGDIFNDEFLYEGKASPKKINKPEEKIYTMGEQVTLPRYRRKADCKFWKAYLWLPQTRQKITLVSRSARDSVDDRLL